MRWIGTQQNVNGPDSEYIYGRIRDWSGTVEGTPVDEALYGDIHQLIAKIIQESGITPNNLPDNEYNGFQIWEALIQHMGGAIKHCKLKCSQSGTSNPTLASVDENSIANDGGDGISSFTRALLGRYDLVFAENNLSLTKTYCCSASEAGFSGFVNFSITATDTIRIETRDATGALSDNILANTNIFIEVVE